MTLASFVISALLVSMLFIGYAKSKVSLTPFGKKVQSLLPEETYDEIFAINIESDDQLLKAIQRATDKFGEVIGTPIQDNIAQKLLDEGKRFGKRGVTSILVFYVHTNALTQTFTDEEVLTGNNDKEVAQKYVDKLKESAMALENENITSVLPELMAAAARLLKYEGVTSSDAVNQFAKNILHELNKYKTQTTDSCSMI